MAHGSVPVIKIQVTEESHTAFQTTSKCNSRLSGFICKRKPDPTWGHIAQVNSFSEDYLEHHEEYVQVTCPKTPSCSKNKI